MLTSKPGAQPRRKSELNGKAQPFLTTGGEAVANHNGFWLRLKAALWLLRNSSKKPLFFDVLKVSSRYLLVEDKQGGSVVNICHQ
jgi:hypothetical protein